MQWALIVFLALAPGVQHSDRARIATINFFGTSGIDVKSVRSALPIHEGDEVVEDNFEQIHDGIVQAVHRSVGHEPTDVDVTCCSERGGWLIYIGLGGRNSRALKFRPAPTGSACLTGKGLRVYQSALAAVSRAIQSGQSDEDDSRGFSLSVDPTARERQLAMHAYADAHQRAIEHALDSCSKANHREAAAALLGYASQSRTQIRSLVKATRDSSPEVRNNAIRALAVLAGSNLKIASQVPATDFIPMLNSGRWLDRNKAGWLLMCLTRSRDQVSLQRLRLEALPSLIEMARWKDQGHATEYGVLLGRIAGFKEEDIDQLLANGKTEDIIAAASKTDFLNKAQIPQN